MELVIQSVTIGIMIMLIGIIVTSLLGNFLFIKSGKSTTAVIPIYMFLLFLTGLITFWISMPIFCLKK